ncbi:uncharacterized [Tachysurus ichikawai]
MQVLVTEVLVTEVLVTEVLVTEVMEVLGTEVLVTEVLVTEVLVTEVMEVLVTEVLVTEVLVLEVMEVLVMEVIVTEVLKTVIFSAANCKDNRYEQDPSDYQTDSLGAHYQSGALEQSFKINRSLCLILPSNTSFQPNASRFHQEAPEQRWMMQYTFLTLPTSEFLSKQRRSQTRVYCH